MLLPQARAIHVLHSDLPQKHYSHPPWLATPLFALSAASGESYITSPLTGGVEKELGKESRAAEYSVADGAESWPNDGVDNMLPPDWE